MNYVLGRLQRQVIQGSARWQISTRCQQHTRFPHAPCRPNRALAGPVSRAFATAEPDHTVSEAKAKKVDQRALDKQEQEVRAKESQLKRPWHRHGVDDPPVEKNDNKAAPVTTGRYRHPFTCPSAVGTAPDTSYDQASS